MKLCTYIITHDTGFAPNPFHGFLTLATCKPTIRRSKNIHVGDWLVGISAKSSLGRDRLIYMAQISEIVSLEEYGDNARFAVKKPGKEGNSIHGDNIYYKDNKAEWQQLPNAAHDKTQQEHDISGKNALIANDFWYFGDHAPKIPKNLDLIGNARTKYLTDERVINDFITWINTFPKGINGTPSMTAKCGASCGNSAVKSSC